MALGPRLDEQLRRVSARSTKYIALLCGRRFPMYVGCGFPKSGTVWLCQLMGTYLGLPYPQNYELPIAMASVIHAHWAYNPRLPKTVYITRDGRDVMVSLYFYNMELIAQRRNPRRAEFLHDRYRHLFGKSYDPMAIQQNLPRFIEDEMLNPHALRGVTWPAHVREWCYDDRSNVSHTRYEQLVEEPERELARTMEDITERPADMDLVDLAVRRFDFRRSGRPAGREDRSSFMRKGTSGDWINHFSREAGEVMEAHAGPELRALGYEHDAGWFQRL